MKDIDHIEIEIKIACDNPTAIENALSDLGAKLIGCWSETDMFFDFEDRRLKRNDSALRLRARDDIHKGDTIYRLTFKGPKMKSDYKCRREIELSVESPDAAQGLLEALGLKPFIAYTKTRHSWRYDNCTIEIDSIPDLGNFIEIEGPDAQSIERVMERLNLTDTPIITKSYLEMIMEHQDNQN